jgi:hypothetical protein
MHSLVKTFLCATFGVTAVAASAGEISGSNIDAYAARNETFADNAEARQSIGSAVRGGTILNSQIWARGTKNDAASVGGWSNQLIGVADGGKMDKVTVWADGAYNRSAGKSAIANQLIGVVGFAGTMTNSTVGATNAFNNANRDGSQANQRIGVVE